METENEFGKAANELGKVDLTGSAWTKIAGITGTPLAALLFVLWTMWTAIQDNSSRHDAATTERAAIVKTLDEIRQDFRGHLQMRAEFAAMQRDYERLRDDVDQLRNN